jgi:putative flippase GtrA
LYIFVGGSAAVVDWSLFWALTAYLEVHYFLAAIFSFLVATFANYIISITLLFQSGSKHKKLKEVTLVYLVSAIGLFINLIVLFVAANYTEASLIYSKVVATGIAFGWNYMLRFLFVFRFKN